MQILCTHRHLEIHKITCRVRLMKKIKGKAEREREREIMKNNFSSFSRGYRISQNFDKNGRGQVIPRKIIIPLFSSLGIIGTILHYSRVDGRGGVFSGKSTKAKR